MSCGVCVGPDIVGRSFRWNLVPPYTMVDQLLRLEALDESGLRPLLVLAITVHEVATTLCYPSYSSFDRVTLSLCESDCLHEVMPFVVDVASSSDSTHIGIAFQPFSRSL